MTDRSDLTDVLAIVHGAADNSLRWIWLSKKHGTTLLAIVDHDHFVLKDYVDAPDGWLTDIGSRLYRLWSEQRAGVSLAGFATHRIDINRYGDIVPLGGQTVFRRSAAPAAAGDPPWH